MSIYSSLTPPKLETKFTIGRWPFLGSTFLCFFEKNVTFLNLHCYIMFFQNCSKSRFTTWNPILCHFFNKNQGSTLRFFSDFDQNSWFLNLPYYIMFYQNCSKSQFYHMKSHFVSFFNKNQDFFFFGFWSKFISHY